MAAKLFNPSSNHAERAVQAWQILVAAAMNRQTLTYTLLGKRMYNGRNAQGVLAPVLGHIAFYCNEHGLPPLTAVVVGAGRGTPGTGIPADVKKLDAAREQVYETDWYDIYPPNAKELRAAFVKHKHA